MTAADVYVVVCLGAAVGLIAVTVGYVIDNWGEWSRRAAAHRLDARWYWGAWNAYAHTVPATVWNPGDPSPRRVVDRAGGR